MLLQLKGESLSPSWVLNHYYLQNAANHSLHEALSVSISFPQYEGNHSGTVLFMWFSTALLTCVDLGQITLAQDLAAPLNFKPIISFDLSVYFPWGQIPLLQNKRVHNLAQCMPTNAYKEAR